MTIQNLFFFGKLIGISLVTVVAVFVGRNRVQFADYNYTNTVTEYVSGCVLV